MRICVAAIILLVATHLFASERRSADNGQRIICTTVHGKIIKLVKPVYPPNAAAHGIRGKVTLQVSINERGEPTNIRFMDGNPIFAESALDAVRQWKWKPLKPNGVAVPVDTSVTVNYVPRRTKKSRT